MIAYYEREIGGAIALARIVVDDETSVSRGFYANRLTSSWVEHPSIVTRASGAGGDADYQRVDRKRALAALGRLGNTRDELDNLPADSVA